MAFEPNSPLELDAVMFALSKGEQAGFVPRLRATFAARDREIAALRATVVAVEKWAMANEIAAPPLDWAGLGSILRQGQNAELTARTGGLPAQTERDDLT